MGEVIYEVEITVDQKTGQIRFDLESPTGETRVLLLGLEVEKRLYAILKKRAGESDDNTHQNMYIMGATRSDDFRI